VRGSVLPVAEHIVRNAVVGRDVIELRDGQGRPHPRLPTIRGDIHVPIVGDDETFRIQGVDPHVVVVGPDLPDLTNSGTAVDGHVQLELGEEVHFVGVVRQYCHARVVMGPPIERVVTADEHPVLASVVGPPQDPLANGALDERVDAVGVARRERQTNTPSGESGSPRPLSRVHVVPPSRDMYRPLPVRHSHGPKAG
jgi:hypothetical protein